MFRKLLCRWRGHVMTREKEKTIHRQFYPYMEKFLSARLVEVSKVCQCCGHEETDWENLRVRYGSDAGYLEQKISTEKIIEKACKKWQLK